LDLNQPSAQPPTHPPTILAGSRTKRSRQLSALEASDGTTIVAVAARKYWDPNNMPGTALLEDI
jgi:hypothetical protein